jgi:hypothetical protein
MTLAADFISNLISLYEDPVRKGVKRGNPVGMHRSKYVSALLDGVYDLTTVEIESIVGVPRGLVSKWRNEVAYARKVDEVRQAFVERLCGSLAKGIVSSEVRDAIHYAPDVKRDFITLCHQAYERGESDLLLRYWPVLERLLSSAHPSLRSPTVFPLDSK